MRVSFLFRLIFDTHILNGKLSLFRVNCQIKSDLLQSIISGLVVLAAPFTLILLEPAFTVAEVSFVNSLIALSLKLTL
ncbi:hypothetical protein BG544_11075 [Mannheimia haemolytica]|nr:hypothetical protein BG544_11075 [Mannheimia haemolytica]